MQSGKWTKIIKKIKLLDIQKISNKLSMDFYDEIINSFSEEERKRLTLNMKKSDYIYLKSEFFDEAHLYNIVNFISEIEKKGK